MAALESKGPKASREIAVSLAFREHVVSLARKAIKVCPASKVKLVHEDLQALLDPEVAQVKKETRATSAYLDVTVFLGAQVLEARRAIVVSQESAARWVHLAREVSPVSLVNKARLATRETGVIKVFPVALEIQVLVAFQAKKATKVTLDLEAQQETSVHKVSPALGVLRARLAVQVKLVSLVSLAVPEILVSQVREALKVSRAIEAIRAIKETLATLAERVFLAVLDRQELRVCLVRMAEMGSKVPKVRLETPALAEARVTRETSDLEASPDPLAQPVAQASTDRQVFRVNADPKALKETLVYPVFLVVAELSVQKAQRVMQVSQVRQVLPAKTGKLLSAELVIAVCPEIRASQAFVGLKVSRDHAVSLGYPDRKVTEVSVVLKAALVSPVSQAPLESRVIKAISAHLALAVQLAKWVLVAQLARSVPKVQAARKVTVEIQDRKVLSVAQARKATEATLVRRAKSDAPANLAQSVQQV